ncbi:kinase-like domain-containing protein [Desarmillaria tabescens]|uniref:Kinase-like domain-containing protein n=1 Tax=Armillaria tabescens TaxID=1929756 RepID=A0AA39U052_ARMTA|nr:kinase-like domain-containing protein [Desarmillaria tabescens]KAK0464295.1 kinase-like domain-containing protein [Desarmillaria tabescens]
MLLSGSASVSDVLRSSPLLASIDPIFCSVTISREIHRGNYARVWRGTLSDGSPLVVKMYPRRHFDVMKKELKAYQYLQSRQLFDVAPAYYGTFTMPDQYWAAMIMADGGESVGCSWKDAGLNPRELKVIWNHCKALHSIGMVHHDLQPRNITRDGNGALRIIDFESAAYGHSCDLMSCMELARKFDSFADGWRQ